MTRGQKAYQEFLKSEFWIELSTKKKEAVGKCERCGTSERLEAHHLFYRSDWYGTEISDLKVYCSKCHQVAHGYGEPMHWDGTNTLSVPCCMVCRFFNDYECHRHAPILADSGDGLESSSPLVDAMYWCGDYEPKRSRIIITSIPQSNNGTSP